MFFSEELFMFAVIKKKNNFVWESADNVNITKVMNKFGISGPELFHVMYLFGSPCNYGILAFDLNSHNDFTVNEAANILTKSNHIDWYNGHGIKNTFRMSVSDEQIINVRRFDDRNYQGCFYNSILSLIKIKKNLYQIN